MDKFDIKDWLKNVGEKMVWRNITTKLDLIFFNLPELMFLFSSNKFHKRYEFKD